MRSLKISEVMWNHIEPIRCGTPVTRVVKALLANHVTGLPVVSALSPEPDSSLPPLSQTLLKSTTRENSLLGKRVTSRRVRRPNNMRQRSMNSLSYDMLWDDQLVSRHPKLPCPLAL